MQRKWGIALLYTLNVLAGLGFFCATNLALILSFGFLTEMLTFLDGQLLHTYEAEIYPTAVRARGVGISLSLSRLGGFLAPIAASCIFRTNPRGEWLIVAAAGAWMICALIAAVVVVDTTNISLESLEGSS